MNANEFRYSDPVNSAIRQGRQPQETRQEPEALDFAGMDWTEADEERIQKSIRQSIAHNASHID